MKKLLLLLSLCFALTLRAADVAPAPSPYAPIAWLAGGVWKAALPPTPDGATVAIELTVVVPENRQGLRFESAFIIGGQRRPYTCGMYAWDAAQHRFTMFYTNASGGLNVGAVTVEDGVLVHEFTETKLDGTVEPLRVRLARAGDQAFTNEIYVQKDGAWTRFISVRYER